MLDCRILEYPTFRQTHLDAKLQFDYRGTFLPLIAVTLAVVFLVPSGID